MSFVLDNIRNAMQDSEPTETRRTFASYHHRLARDHLLEYIHTYITRPEMCSPIPSLCATVVIQNVSYMECRINEYWAGVISGGRDAWGLTIDEISRFRAVAQTLPWKRKYSILEKYQTACEILGRTMFEKREKTYQDAETAILLRNELVHYEPRDYIYKDGSKITARIGIEARLRAKVPETKYGDFAPQFPDNFFNIECAEWSTNRTQYFVDEFLTRVGASTKVFKSTVEYDY